jgi:hypothetical protein
MTHAATTVAVVEPVTGEALELESMAPTELAERLEALDELRGRLGDYRRALIDEAASRLDAENTRKRIFGDFELETNAPSEETYTPARVRAALAPLVAAGKLTAEALDRILVTPDPAPPAERVDKRELNKLKRSPDGDVLRAIHAARDVRPATRTLKVNRRSTASTAEEV